MTAARSTQDENTRDREIVMTRVLAASRELVWEAMTKPEHVANWWGPRGFSTTIEKLDFRVGGIWKQVMHGPDGSNYPNEHVFQEINKPERIVFAHGGRREGGPGYKFSGDLDFRGAGSWKNPGDDPHGLSFSRRA